jgi:protease-4
MAPTKILLELDLAAGLLEAPPADPLGAWRVRATPTLADIVRKLRDARERDEVVGLLAHVGGSEIDPSQAEELGEAVEAFGAAGKPTVCWTETFGETGNGTVDYHLAAHFAEIWLQPSGGLALVGFAAQGVFARDALDRLGVEPQFRMRKEYKNAPDTLLRQSMGDAQREAMQRLTDGMTAAVVSTVARRRSLDVDAARAVIADAPLTAAEAQQRGLVDRIGYRDEAYEELNRRAGVELVQRYVHRWSPPRRAVMRQRLRRELPRRLGRRRPSTIAVVPVVGGIMLGRSGGSPVMGRTAGSETVCAALRAARSADDIGAVVLRVVSPGGSYTASDAIHREVLRLRETGRPVVASMGGVAASGGYFVAMAADEIVALPSTVTGSIGVFAGKLVVREALAKVGVAREIVASGQQAAMWSANRPFTEDELLRLDRWLDDVYADFTRKAASGRGMEIEDLEALARGRVWTGADAVERGLVDGVGGLESAVAAAARLARVEPADTDVVRYPQVSPLARLRPPTHSDAPNAAIARAELPGVAGLAQLASPEALLARLGAEFGLGAGVVRLPPGLRAP